MTLSKNKLVSTSSIQNSSYNNNNNNLNATIQSSIGNFNECADCGLSSN